MKKINIIYWIFTVLICGLMLFSSIGSFADPVASKAMMEGHFGYPPYITVFLSIAKILGVIALLVPGFPRLKEWAYAGFFFDLTGAMYSSIMVKDPIDGVLFFIVFYVFLFGSYIYHHKRLKYRAQNA